MKVQNPLFHDRLETLRGKVVWITGAGSGIGKQLAFALAKVGAKLVLHSLQGEDLDSVRTICLGEDIRKAIPGLVVRPA